MLLTDMSCSESQVILCFLDLNNAIVLNLHKKYILHWLKSYLQAHSDSNKLKVTIEIPQTVAVRDHWQTLEEHIYLTGNNVFLSIVSSQALLLSSQVFHKATS